MVPHVTHVSFVLAVLLAPGPAAGRHPHGGGLVGRQVAEVGHSIALNSSRGQRPLDELWVAFGPGRIRVRNVGRARDPSLRVNVSSLGAAIDYALGSDTRFSPGESLATRLVTAPLEQYLWDRVGLRAPVFGAVEP